MLRGLAAEHRRFPLLERQQRKQAGTAWARQQAQDLLALADTQDLHEVLRELDGKVQQRSAAPSLFSWVKQTPAPSLANLTRSRAKVGRSPERRVKP